MSHYFLCSQNKHSKNRRFFQCMVSDFVAAEFPKTPSPKPARIPPHTPPTGGKTDEAGRIHIPRKLFRPASSTLVLFKKSSRKVYNYSTSSNLFGIKNVERFCGSQNRTLIFAKTLSAYGENKSGFCPAERGVLAARSSQFRTSYYWCRGEDLNLHGLSPATTSR